MSKFPATQISLLELQEKVDIWAETLLQGNSANPPSISLHLLEEAVELCMSYGLSSNIIGAVVRGELVKQEKKRTDPLAKQEGPDCELGDMLLLACRIANEEGWNLAQLGNLRFDHNLPQKWNVTSEGDFRRFKP